MTDSWDSAFLKSITDGLDMLRDRQLYTDITICLDGGATYRCHKAVLCSLSNYFNSMFSSNMSEGQCEQVSLPLTLFDSEIFETLLDFFYSGKDVVTLANAEDIIRAASFLQIQCLQDRCEKVLVDSVTDANCIRLWQLARLHNYRLLDEKAWNLLMTEFPTVANTDSFLELDVDELVRVLEADELVTPTEGVVCNGAMRWLESDIDQRQQFLAQILESLKLPLTSSDYLRRLTSQYPFIEEDKDGNAFLIEARSYHKKPEQQRDLCTPRTKHRRASGIDDQDTLIVVAGCEFNMPDGYG
jgi:hypothetical protein